MSERTVEFEGKYIRLIREADWEYVERCSGMTAVVILAEHDGKVILVEQDRVPIGRRCLELPAGLVGDEDDKGVEETALKELEEETGFKAGWIERLGDFHSSPGVLAESFSLVRAHDVRPGGEKSDEPIEVHLVDRADMAEFIAEKRRRGVAVDTRLLLFLGDTIAP